MLPSADVLIAVFSLRDILWLEIVFVQYQICICFIE